MRRVRTFDINHILNRGYQSTSYFKVKHFFNVWGPGLIVMLADTDAGCLITAAQSGAQWGYTMILPQILLIPVLYFAQEMTVRLGIAGVGEMFGISKWITIPIATVLLIAIAFSGSYRRVEKVGVMIGLAELAFLVVVVMVKPQLGDMVRGIGTIPWHNSSYIYLVAANVGAVIMPWMIFYQQGAVVDKNLGVESINKEKHDTFVGTLVTQGIMLTFVIAFAATMGLQHQQVALETVSDLASGLSAFIGSYPAKLFTGMSLLGGSLVAALVVALAGTWGVTEVLNWKHSLNEPLQKGSIGFYIIYCLAHIIGAILVLANINLVNLAVSVEVMNALLLPIVLGFLLILEAKVLPEKYRMHGVYRWLVTVLCMVVMGFGLYMVGPIMGIW
ncbi:NRAMP family divalent metal transporter [Pediococcus pentosaceus]|uniref:NRAMP family divalent metal transporter n=1 Tax=Pediococcus pentosaceus TaxID=1255 RepID=UPI004035D867